MKVAVAVSGGADSLYALSALKMSGYELLALHGLFVSPSRDPVPGLREQCARLEIPLHVADLRKEFARLVIDPFVAAYAEGQTPNPCARCNSAIKFGLLLDLAEEFGAQRLATGHYAEFADHPVYGAALRRAEDFSRDQSYFLSLVPKERLARALFPLARTLKSALPGKLAERGLAAPLPEESREVCFVPDDEYRTFLEGRADRLSGSGPICLRDGRTVGRHEGLWRHTEGQRRGLGVAWSEALYVLEKDRARNALVVGSAEELQARDCRAGQCNVFVPSSLWPERVFASSRYRQPAQAADARLEDGGLHVRFYEPQMVGAPGQVLCVRDADGWTLAAGVIRAAS
ncbi:MAG: tRNA-specific 2-thiouridylase [Deltaproteobacteria bacterium]|jgi:tRNA-specific 2-thiouridylase|nr:tRNA-specific 2-thiouridylase [Deltaproteobacteria bacterium]